MKCFYYVVKHNSFTIASEELFLARTAISKRVHDFENEFDYELIIRHNNTFALTDYGKVIFEKVEKIIHSLETFELRTKYNRKLQIGISGLYVTWSEAIVLEIFKETFWNIQFVYGDFEFLSSQLLEGYIDGIFCGNRIPNTRFESLKISKHQFLLCCLPKWDINLPYNVFIYNSFSLRKQKVLDFLEQFPLSPKNLFYIENAILDPLNEINYKNDLIVVLDELVQSKINNEELKILGTIDSFESQFLFLKQNRYLCNHITKYKRARGDDELE